MEEGLLRKGESLCGIGGGECRWAAETKEEGRRLGRVAAPMVAVMLSQYLVQVVSTMMVGHLGELALASSSIAASLTGVTGFSLLLGMASGLETLCGQAYGAQQYEKLATHMYRAMLCLAFISIPISILWLNLGKLLVLLHQDPAISHEAGKYAVWSIPALFAYAAVQPLMKFLQAQSLIFPMLCTSFLSLCLHVPLCWVLVYKSGMGLLGAALANSISYWVNVVVLGVYVKYSDSCKVTRTPPSKEALQGIYDFFGVALPSAVMICLEWWSFELLVLLSGLLPNPALETSVLSICLTSISTLYCIPYGLGAAASTRVSNELGAGNPKGARVAVRVAMLTAVTEAFIVGISIFLLRNVYGYAYSNEKEVVDYVTKMAPLISLSVIMDSLQGVLSGIARGCGMQHLGAYVNLGAFYLIGIPMAAVLGFWLDLRGIGLWIGILSGAIVQSLLLSLITFFTNWQQQVNNARERIFGEIFGKADILK